MEFQYLDGEQKLAKEKSRFGEGCFLRLIIPSVHCTESFEVWPNASAFWQSIFPGFLEMRLGLLSLDLMAMVVT